MEDSLGGALDTSLSPTEGDSDSVLGVDSALAKQLRNQKEAEFTKHSVRVNVVVFAAWQQIILSWVTTIPAPLRCTACVV